MNRTLRLLAPNVSGLIGGVLGLLWSSLLTIAASNFNGCSCGFNSVITSTWFLVDASVVGLVGSAVLLLNRYAGGAMLVAGGLIALAPPAVLSGTFFWFPFWLFFAPNLISGFLLILGGLLAFPKTRHLIKTLHDGGWIP